MRRWNSAHVQESSRICAGCSRRRRSSRRSVEEDSPSQHPRRDPCRMHVARMRTDRRAAATPTVFIQVSACDAHHRAFARISHLSQRHESLVEHVPSALHNFSSLFVSGRRPRMCVCILFIRFFLPVPCRAIAIHTNIGVLLPRTCQQNNNYKRQYDKYVRHGTRTVH